jgi:long-subunit acyl-CoA synthetase (AMP-forming)/pyrroloquinoline quinone (PQQ) biosynthesis protein C
MSRVLQAIAGHAAEKSQAIALSDGRDDLSYTALWQNVQTSADLLRQQCPGDGPIALLADNSAGWVILDLAAIALARPLVPLPLFLSDEQRRHAIAQIGAAWLISDGGAAGEQAFDVAGTTFFSAKLNGSHVALPQNTAKITFTSGTTGAPRGVCLSQAGMEAVAASLVEVIGADKAGIHLAVLPLSVLLENVAGLYSTLLVGGHYRALPQAALGFARPFAPDFELLIDALRTNQASTAIMVPEILRGAIAVLRRRGIALRDLKFLAVGGARVAEQLLAEAQQLGLPLYQGYGLSEAGSVATLNSPQADRRGSVGRLLPHVNMHFAADGEILLSKPGYLGYVDGAPAPQVHPTGDIGSVDDDGFVFIHGRKSNVLITGFGRNVSPEWIESELAAEPEVYQALVFGDDQPALMALVVPSSDSVTDGQLVMAIDAVNRKLPDYARVRRWLKVAPFTPQNGQLTANCRLKRDAIYERHGDCMSELMLRSTQDVTFFERLVAETERQRDYLMATEQLQLGLAGRISVDTYVQYLGEAYHHVRHTVPLLQQAIARLPPGREWLAGPLNDYIAEETGHEEWILDDIRHAGGDAKAVRNGRPRMATEFMVAYAYDFINRVNAVGFLGMVFVLESTSTKLATAGAQSLMQSLGLPANCFRYLASHGALDIEHMQFFESIIAHIDHDDDKAAVVHMAQRIYVLFANLFRAIPLDHSGRNGIL